MIIYRSIQKAVNFNTSFPIMTPKPDVRQQHSLIKNNNRKSRLGYPVTCVKFYGNKEDAKSDHQKMLAATCMSYENIFSFIY